MSKELKKLGSKIISQNEIEEGNKFDGIITCTEKQETECFKKNRNDQKLQQTLKEKTKLLSKIVHETKNLTLSRSLTTFASSEELSSYSFHNSSISLAA